MFDVQGIGVETARALAMTKAHLFLTARDMNRGQTIVEDIKKSTGNNRIDLLELDLTSLESVRKCVKQFQSYQLPIHILICKL